MECRMVVGMMMESLDVLSKVKVTWLLRTFNWLGTLIVDDLVNYFDRHRWRRRHPMMIHNHKSWDGGCHVANKRAQILLKSISKGAELKLEEIERYCTPLKQWVNWHSFPTWNNVLELSSPHHNTLHKFEGSLVNCQKISTKRKSKGN